MCMYAAQGVRTLMVCRQSKQPCGVAGAQCCIMWCCSVQSRAIHKARLSNKTEARERGTTTEVQKANEKVSALIAHKGEEEAKEEVG